MRDSRFIMDGDFGDFTDVSKDVLLKQKQISVKMILREENVIKLAINPLT